MENHCFVIPNRRSQRRMQTSLEGGSWTVASIDGVIFFSKSRDDNFVLFWTFFNESTNKILAFNENSQKKFFQMQEEDKRVWRDYPLPNYSWRCSLKRNDHTNFIVALLDLHILFWDYAPLPIPPSIRIILFVKFFKFSIVKFSPFSFFLLLFA